MAVNFIARKCACGGKLEFDPAKKIWICKYCGTVVEREATFDKVQVDGIEGINDVVRQTLMDVANNKMESAGRNLEDCERKNHKHVGTLIANISYNLAMISMARSQEEARGYLDKVKLYAKRLNEEYPSIAEDEINMYEAFGEGVADIYANLLVVFDTLNDGGRVEYISSRLKPAEIFSEHANGTLLKISLKRENYDVAETVLRNTNHIDRKSGLQELMLHYPDNGRKQELLGLMVKEPHIPPEALSAIRCPTLVVAGERDMIREDHIRQLAAAIPGAALSILPGDHFVAQTNHEAFNRTVLEFLRSGEQEETL